MRTALIIVFPKAAEISEQKIGPNRCWSSLIKFKNVISGILFNDEQYHLKLKHSRNFDKNKDQKNKFLSIKLYIWLTHARSQFQSKYSKSGC